MAKKKATVDEALAKMNRCREQFEELSARHILARVEHNELRVKVGELEQECHSLSLRLSEASDRWMDAVTEYRGMKDD